MDILLISLMIFITLTVLGYPLINAKKYSQVRVMRGNGKLDALENERAQTLDAIRDLQFDHMTGKLSDEDYQSLRTQYEFKAAQVLQQLDLLKGQPPKVVNGNKSCARCHTLNDVADKFCVKCGSKL